MVIFAHPHPDPGCAVTYILLSLDIPARNLNKGCITVIQPGQDKSMDGLLCICQ